MKPQDPKAAVLPDGIRLDYAKAINLTGFQDKLKKVIPGICTFNKHP